jgi:transcriptional regulator with XRE-family HTH domain
MAPIASTDLSTAIADTLRRARIAKGMSVNALAERAEVSRAMIGKIERGDAQPTAALLGRLSAALEMTLSQLLATAEEPLRRLARRAEQPTWTDPATGYTRRSVSPRAGGAMELVDVELPPGAEVAYPADAFRFTRHQIWVLRGRLHFTEGGVEYELATGDCLELGEASPCVYRNRTEHATRYLVAITPLRAAG